MIISQSQAKLSTPMELMMSPYTRDNSQPHIKQMLRLQMTEEDDMIYSPLRMPPQFHKPDEDHTDQPVANPKTGKPLDLEMKQSTNTNQRLAKQKRGSKNISSKLLERNSTYNGNLSFMNSTEHSLKANINYPFLKQLEAKHISSPFQVSPQHVVLANKLKPFLSKREEIEATASTPAPLLETDRQNSNPSLKPLEVKFEPLGDKFNM